jgi:hypothetical protein
MTAEEKLSKAIHDNLSNAAERVVHAAIDFVLDESEDTNPCALASAVYSFLDADNAHDALVALHPAETTTAKIKKPKKHGKAAKEPKEITETSSLEG